MKRLFFMIAVMIAMGAVTETSAQIRKSMKMANRADNNDKNAPYPQRNIRPFRFVQPSANVSYDAMTTILNVDFPTNSLGGTIEVFKNGSKIGTTTLNAGTSFGCLLMDYGKGQYNVIVSYGNTILYSKNIEVK